MGSKLIWFVSLIVMNKNILVRSSRPRLQYHYLKIPVLPSEL